MLAMVKKFIGASNLDFKGFCMQVQRLLNLNMKEICELLFYNFFD